MSSDIGSSLRNQIAERAYHVCEYCLIHEDDTFWGCQVDHIISRKHGGISDPSNLAWSCACCNCNKGSDLATLVGQPPQLVPLFHPRLERWSDTFQLQGVSILGLKPSGTATVKLLCMNEEYRLQERSALAETGRYPTVEAMARMKE